MIKNYIKVSIRNIKKYLVFSSLNVIGLGIGMAAFFLITTWVNFERSYEDFVPENNKVFRVTLHQYLNGELSLKSAENYPGLAPALLAEVPEVESFARLYNMGYKNNVVISWEDAPGEPVNFKHRKFLYADSSFLPMMGYDLKYGDASTALAEPFSIIITEEYAKKYFGEVDPLGKMLRLQDDDFNNELCKVTGVVKEAPMNTHLKFDVLISYKTLYARGDWAPSRYNESWQRKDMYTYIKLRSEGSEDIVESKLSQLIEKYSPHTESEVREDRMFLQPITSIHLNSDLAEESEINGNGRNVDFLEIIGFIICVLAWVNYINLSTAKSIERSMEVGLRKVLGAEKNGLIGQFIVETGIINLIALVLGIAIILLVLPFFNELSGVNFDISVFLSTKFLSLVGVTWLIGTLVAGLYPGLVISSFKPAVALKGASKGKGVGATLRRALVVFQFVIAAMLITSTIIVRDQLGFLMDKDIGMKVDNILVAERPAVAEDRDILVQNMEVFRNLVVEHPGIDKVSTSITIPGKKREYKVPVKKYGDLDENSVTLRLNSMDYDFIDVFEMDIIAGRAFSRDFPNDPDTAAILSESAVYDLGYEKPEDIIGESLSIPRFGMNSIVVGVVNDYHQESLKKAKDPMFFFFSGNSEFFSMKINNNDFQPAIDHVKSSWNTAFPGNPIDYFFLDDYFNAQYEKDLKFSSLFSYFSVLTIIIGCLGLFGLSAFSIKKRTKEIGIRKVLGSTDGNLLAVLSTSFLGTIAIAFFISLPITFILMQDWLETFATRMSMGVTPYLISALIIGLITILTIGYNVFKATKLNPSDILRNE